MPQRKILAKHAELKDVVQVVDAWSDHFITLSRQELDFILDHVPSSNAQDKLRSLRDGMRHPCLGYRMACPSCGHKFSLPRRTELSKWELDRLQFRCEKCNYSVKAISHEDN